MQLQNRDLLNKVDDTDQLEYCFSVIKKKMGIFLQLHHSNPTEDNVKNKPKCFL